MMQSCASAATLRSGGPILPFGMKAKGRLGIPPPRTVIGVPSQAYGQGRVHHDKRRRAIGQLGGVAGRRRAAGVNRLKRSQAGKRGIWARSLVTVQRDQYPPVTFLL